MKRRIYVASSWRNQKQPSVVDALRWGGHEVYDFRNPEHSNAEHGNAGKAGFHWSDIDPSWKDWTPAEFAEGLQHDIARGGFDRDMAAMDWADTCVLVMPCGRSAHLEAGWFAGRGKEVFILLASGEPELMYRMVTGMVLSVSALLEHMEERAPEMIPAVCDVCGAEASQIWSYGPSFEGARCFDHYKDPSTIDRGAKGDPRADWGSEWEKVDQAGTLLRFRLPNGWLVQNIEGTTMVYVPHCHEAG